jgi:hypothetical protein
MLVGMKELAETTGNREFGKKLAASVESALAQFIDDYCGTPWPLPGGPPWASILAAELVSEANTQTGSFRSGLMQLAARVAEKAFRAAEATVAGV